MLNSNVQYTVEENEFKFVASGVLYLWYIEVTERNDNIDLLLLLEFLLVLPHRLIGILSIKKRYHLSSGQYSKRIMSIHRVPVFSTGQLVIYLNFGAIERILAVKRSRVRQHSNQAHFAFVLAVLAFESDNLVRLLVLFEGLVLLHVCVDQCALVFPAAISQYLRYSFHTNSVARISLIIATIIICLSKSCFKTYLVLWQTYL